MVQLLLLKARNKDAFDGRERTPLFFSASRGQAAATLALLTAGADVNLRCGQFKSPVIYAAAETWPVEILRAVIEHGADVDAGDTDDETALHAAARGNNVEAVNVLIEAGTNVEARDWHGRTPLHFASKNSSRETVLTLLKHGAVVNAQNEYLETPLILAAGRAGTRETAEVVDSLLREGADETTFGFEGKKAADVIGSEVEEDDILVEDVERVRKLLANAPADRAWRRRGYLVLCRAHPDILLQSRGLSGTHHADTARRTRSCVELARAGGVAGDSRVDGRSGGDWTVVVANVLRLQEEGVFRTIVGYL